MSMLYDIWLRNYPQPDINVTEEWELGAKSLKDANKLIHQMEVDYADDLWKGHRLYRAKFYAETSTKFVRG